MMSNNNKYIIVPDTKTFTFKGLCPYCKSDLTYCVTGWEFDEETGLWIADTLESECDSEPSYIGSEEWNEWLNSHLDLPYVYQLPVDQSVLAFINKKFRFKLD